MFLHVSFSIKLGKKLVSVFDFSTLLDKSTKLNVVQNLCCLEISTQIIFLCLKFTEGNLWPFIILSYSG